MSRLPKSLHWLNKIQKTDAEEAWSAQASWNWNDMDTHTPMLGQRMKQRGNGSVLRADGGQMDKRAQNMYPLIQATGLSIPDFLAISGHDWRRSQVSQLAVYCLGVPADNSQAVWRTAIFR